MSNGAPIIIAAAIAHAIKASGTLVRIEQDEFFKIRRKSQNPLVLTCPGGRFSRWEYLTSYKGFGFYTRSKMPLNLPSAIELVTVKSIWMPE